MGRRDEPLALAPRQCGSGANSVKPLGEPGLGEQQFAAIAGLASIADDGTLRGISDRRNRRRPPTFVRGIPGRRTATIHAATFVKMSATG